MTEALLDILTQERAPATFFVIGRHITAYPDLARKIAGYRALLGDASAQVLLMISRERSEAVLARAAE